jgi:peptidoglycan/xylan/chitin deacetylase (PgdA/CDA1 family)
MTMRILKHAIPIIVVLTALFTVRLQGTGNAPDQGLTPDGTLRRLRVPILMYHYISELPPQADHLRIGLTVHPQQFREHLDYLRANGYTTVSLYEVHLALTQGHRLPPNPIALTFDDGYSDHLYTAMPLLREYGFKGTFFIITGFADEQRNGYLNWEQVQQLGASGMEIAAHSKTHPDLRGRNHDFLVYEMLGSLESIKVNLGLPQVAFAYPMGRYDDATLGVLKQTDTLLAVTTEHGATHTTDGRHEMRRLRVQNTTSTSGLAALLREK